ncbi:hypothetical protein GWK47_051754 [Chionoecetes opilio]|uniref:Homeobox domain-containing protein n=1 Tax=Chionoecetes opilio TaxID=41210 RepID=A0A8J5CBW7_CHIOP|nr:hypothetical protein GWK47_051754 [Chionoecetes opilio]
MLTQLELHGATGSLGVDEDSGMSGSPLDGLAEYPMEQAEFEYFDTSLGSDAYYDGPQHQDLQQSLAVTPDLTSPSMCGITENILIYDQENIPNFIAEDLKFPEDIKPYEDALQAGEVELKFEEDIQDYEKFAKTFTRTAWGVTMHTRTISALATCTKRWTLNTTYPVQRSRQIISGVRLKFLSSASLTSSSKTKVGPLQRRALDSIFRVTDKPSRGLLLHIASELNLHHITVKNFFANARRRLRRAAARLNDPERTRRENERRKEKRRLAALASATQGSPEGKGGVGSASVKMSSPRRSPSDSPPPREPPVVSPERKALMEKLADKVQRSVAQRSLAAELELPSCNPSQHPSNPSCSSNTPSSLPLPTTPSTCWPHRSHHITRCLKTIFFHKPLQSCCPKPHTTSWHSPHTTC